MNDAAKIRSLRDALDSYPLGDPFRSAIQRGFDHLLDEPEPLPTDNRPRDALTNRPITFRAKASINRLAPHAGGGRTIPHSSDPLPPKIF